MTGSRGDDAATGIEGLDDVLAGGLARGRVFLFEGSPGTGKTTIATQFLLAGAAAGERVLYITNWRRITVPNAAGCASSSIGDAVSAAASMISRSGSCRRRW